MDEVKVKTIDINGDKYFCIDEIVSNDICYCYFSKMDNEYDVQVLIKNGDSYKSISTKMEYVDAMKLFYDKYSEKNTD